MTSPGVPGDDAARRGRASARASPSGASSSSARGSSRTRSSAITGTNGKTTTTALLGEMFRAARLPAEVVGQHRSSAHLRSSGPSTRPPGSSARWACSSSTTSRRFRPRIAVLLNLEPDHLDRYGTFEWYADTKLRIFEQQTEDDTAIVPRGFGPIPGARAPGRVLRTTIRFPPSPRSPACTTARTPPRRPPPRARPASRTTRSRRRSTAFRGVPHRIEDVRELARRPLRQRLEGDERRRGAARDRGAPRLAAARHPRRPRQERELRAAGGGARAGRPRVSDRRRRRRDRRRARRRRRPVTPVAAISRPLSPRRRKPRVPGRDRPPLAGLRELRPVPRLRGARRRVPPPRRGALVKARQPLRPEAPRPRDARARRVRPRDGVQRDLRVGRARQRRPDELPQATGDLRAARRRADGARVALRLPPPALRRAAAPARRARPLRGRARRRAGDQRRAPLVPPRPGELPALGAREARALPLRSGLSRAAPSAADARRAREAARPR